MGISKSKIAPQSFDAWLHAARPKTWPIAFLPPSLGFLMGPHYLAEVQWSLLVSFFLASWFLIIGMNLINDACDFRSGVDTSSRIGPLKVTVNGLLSDKQLLMAGKGCLALTILFSLPLIGHGGAIFGVIAAFAVLCGYVYTAGPYPISYAGLSEVFIIAFYGFLATMSAYYLENKTLDVESAVAGFQIGCLAAVLNALNNLRDIHEDGRAGKNTLAVRYGVRFGRLEVAFLLFLPYAAGFYWYFKGQFFPFFLPMTTLLMAINLVRSIFRHEPSRIYNRFFGEAALLILLFGALLVLGFRV